MGLRAQLVLGLALIIAMVVVSVSLLSLWASRSQNVSRVLDSRRRLAKASATVLAPLLERRAWRQLALTVGRVGRLARATQVYDRRGRAMAGDRLQIPAPLLRGALKTQHQQTRFDRKSMLLVTPIFGLDEQVVGALAQRFGAAKEVVALPPIYYVVMVIDGLVLLAFVYIMVSRTVARPLRELEQAAAAVARGELDHRVKPQGPQELISLARSFNSMTEALAEQLGRLEEQRQSLIRSEKLASVGRLAAGVAHEIGNPLQSVIGFTDILIDSPPKHERQADLLRRVQAEAQRIHRIVGQLLDYSRPVDEEAESVDVAAVVEEALGLLQPQRRFKAASLKRSEALVELPPASINRGRLVQVLVNLLLNAADALGEGDGEAKGEIRLEGRLDDDGERLLLAVEDDGASIPAELREQIFDPFFTTKEPGEGTGLGLAVSRSIVESFGGELYLAEGERTRFEIVLERWRGAENPPCQ